MSARIQTLVDLVPLSMLENILDRFSRATGLKTLITDNRGRPITKTTNFNCFCKKLRTNPDLERKCIRSDANAGIEAAELGKSLIYKCYAGMIDTATPIVVDDIFLGTVFTGQVLLQEDEMKNIDVLFGNSEDISDEPEIVHFREDFLKRHDRMSLSQLEGYVELLQTIAHYIGELGASNIANKDIQKQKEKLLKEQEQREKLKDEMMTLERNAMLNQLSPMFLYNAFNTIHRQSILENAPRTTKLLESLTSLIRRNLNSSHSAVSIQQEIDYIHAYLQLENISRCYDIHLVEDIDPRSNMMKLPFTTLQHLVQCLFVDNSGNKDVGIYLKTEVQDNGALNLELFSPKIVVNQSEQTSQLNLLTPNLASVSVDNVVTFLKQYYKDKFEHRLESSENLGTRFSMTIMNV